MAQHNDQHQMAETLHPFGQFGYFRVLAMTVQEVIEQSDQNNDMLAQCNEPPLEFEEATNVAPDLPKALEQVLSRYEMPSQLYHQIMDETEQIAREVAKLLPPRTARGPRQRGHPQTSPFTNPANNLKDQHQPGQFNYHGSGVGPADAQLPGTEPQAYRDHPKAACKLNRIRDIRRYAALPFLATAVGCEFLASLAQHYGPAGKLATRMFIAAGVLAEFAANIPVQPEDRTKGPG